jgi:hypothetical protein
MMMSKIEKAKILIQKNEQKLEISFFILGFLFDIMTLSSVDDTFGLVQQVLYLWIIGSFLYFDTLEKAQLWQPQKWLLKIWQYRSLILHFLLGSLLSLYSLFFIKSSSLFSSFIFILFLLALLVMNEMSFVQKGNLSVKTGFFVLCLFSFFSLVVPTFLGFVGWIPFLLSLALTLGVLFLIFKKLQKKLVDPRQLFRSLMGPSLGVLSVFTLFYVLGWVPPVPLSVKYMGVYHDIKVQNGQYELKYQRDSWKFWQNGAQNFKAYPGDKLVLFTQVSSPSKFSDQVIYHWSLYSKKKGWVTQDKIPIQVKGGRQNGFRGYGVKQNFVAGEWRVLVETTHGREIGRIYFDVEKLNEVVDPAVREFKTDFF